MRKAILVSIIMLLVGLQGCGRVSATPSQAPAATADATIQQSITEEPMDTASVPQKPTDQASAEGDLLDRLAEDTWAYLSSEWATANHLPCSWRSAEITGGDYANTAEIGLYALSWLAAHDLQRAWSPTWTETEAEVTAVLDQLRAWQTGAQNAYASSVFYQWYWISKEPPVVGEGDADHVVPSIDNAWLAASLITIREYAETNDYAALAQKAEDILGDMDFTLWYDADTYLFSWGALENPQAGTMADYYSNENRIINFVARALGHLTAEEFRLSLEALEQLPGTYGDITVEKVAWDGSYFTYASPALFIKEMATSYGANTIIPATEAQIAYALDQEEYDAWGLSDCFDVDSGGYVQQGAPPVAMTDPPETRPGLVSPHASALALITPLSAEAITNLQTISDTFECAYDSDYGFLDSVMVDPDASDYDKCSERFSALAQEWIFLSTVNHETGFIWDYFYRDEGVTRAYLEMYRESQVHLPMIVNSSIWLQEVQSSRAGFVEAP